MTVVVDTNVLIEPFQPKANAEAVQRVWAWDRDWRLPPLWVCEFLVPLVFGINAFAAKT